MMIKYKKPYYNLDNMDTLFLLFLILVLILIIAFYFTVVNINYTTHDININGNANDNKKNDEIVIDTTGYKNELMHKSENIKDGDYVAQFKPIIAETKPKVNNQDPNCSYGDLPFANVNVNYLLTNC
jgi:hypothetical protein